ncbi:MAG: cysteine protease [Thiobacillaceae bacterium]|jgi:C1A family cysteine protease|nr:cysteine protease [Thiobacillaceae bacterium]
MSDETLSLGWMRDLPDVRDYISETKEIAGILKQSKPLKGTLKAAPASVDLRPWCSPIENQGGIGSCTAHAGVGMMEYYQRRAFGKHLDASRLFLYKATRNLLGWTGDTGAYLRDTMKAMVLFGIPPESHWKYDTAKYDQEPSAFLYAYAQAYQSLRYYRLDPAGTSTTTLLDRVKANLGAGLPPMFGFTVYSSIPGSGDGKGDIPFPKAGDKVLGGHAVLAVGYDDNKKIGAHKGALLIRNSWGTGWGASGYGWLPYQYLLSGLAVDFWSLIQAEFVDSDLFR